MGNNVLIYVILAAGAAYWYFKMDGKSQVDSILSDLKGGGGGLNLGGSGGGTFTDEKGNNVNIQGRGKICINGKCYEGSGQDIQENHQSNVGTGGTITQKQSHSQKSNVFYTIPRFGNI